MPNIPLPNRGQPIDVSYLYQIADAVNSLTTSVSAASNKYVTVDTLSFGKKDLGASEMRMVGGYAEVANNTPVGVGGELPFFLTYSGFKHAPIVTATPINIGGTTAGSDISVVLKTVTASRVDGIVKFKTGGNVTIGVNLIAIGLPN